MSEQYFSRNGELLPVSQAVVPLDNIAYSYGYGVYETIRVHQGIPYFAEQHYGRLMHSAEVITLDHPFDEAFVAKNVTALIEANQLTTANLKILLIGGAGREEATLYILSLNPHFPDRKLYRDGAVCITTRLERAYPTAKTLNMLPSYLAYKAAQTAGAYDALLLDGSDTLREGTRTNFFVLQDKTIIGAPQDSILAGVMRQAVLQVAERQGFRVLEQVIPRNSLEQYDAAFLTSTSSKIMPIRQIDDHEFGEPAPALRELMQHFNDFYDNCSGALSWKPS